MREMNERDLERVSGGFDQDAWLDRNCHQCANYRDRACPPRIQVVAIINAEDYAQSGRAWSCPEKR